MTFSFLRRFSVSASLIAILCACHAMNPLSVAEPVLEVNTQAQHTSLSISQLLQSPDLQTILISQDVAYHRDLSYQAVPLNRLLPDLKKEGNLQFTATDGFVATIPNASFQGTAQAWLAIENPLQPWAPLAEGKKSAGPFYLVWTDAEKSAISNEQWPYQIIRIAEIQTLEQRFPQLLPHAEGAAQIIALRGLQVYTKNCASCHSLNHGGDAQIGPDLNLPMNPTEYFQEDMLRKMIRNPSSVRSWKQSTMPGFSEQSVSPAELDDLLVYLRQMAQQRTR